jgi:hypothetical protein
MVKIHLFRISLNYDAISFADWKLISIDEYSDMKTYSFEKTIEDTLIGFTFIKDSLFLSDKMRYNLMKEFNKGDSIFNLGLTLSADTLFFNKRYKDIDFFFPHNGTFIKGKYFYYYYIKNNLLDSCQVKYFEQNSDSLIKACANNIPRFNERCEIIE